MRSWLVGLSLAVALPLTGCSSIFGPDEDALDVELVTRQAVYEPGVEVPVTLHNRTSHDLPTSMCHVALDAREDGGWERVPYEGLWLCPAVVEVEAHDSLRGRVPLPSDLAAGEYRARTYVRHPDTGHRQDVTAVFQVVP